MKFRIDTAKGFTLLEILVSVAIISVMFGAGVAAYRRFDDRQKVTQAGREFTIALRDLQKRAQSSEKPGQCTSNQVLDGWKLLWASDTSYQILAVCDDTDVASTSTTVNLPIGIRFVPINFSILFSVISGEMSITGLSGGPDYLLTLEDSSADYLYTIKLTNAGGISDAGVTQQ